MAQTDYQQLQKLSREIRLLEGIDSLLSWDQETFMPEGAAPIRSEQRALLAGMIHNLRTGAPFRTVLKKLINLESGKILTKDLSDKQQAALREWRRDDRHATSLPNDFVRHFAETTSAGVMVWREARRNDDFDAFLPHLEKIVALNQQKAEYLGYQEHPYDALVDLFEPGITTAQISRLFNELKEGIIPLLESLQASQEIDDSILHGHFERDQQLQLARNLMECIGYNKQQGRLDESTHPFSSAAHPSDSRITTRIDLKNVLSNLLCVLHESGHGLYEMGLSTEEYGSPLGDAASYGVHESQSRLWETLIGQSRSFWIYYFPRLQAAFPDHFNKSTVEEIYRAVNKVNPSFIRVEADEVTYGLHVILRFELEKQLIEGSLKVHEVPEAWNAHMQDLLGLNPPSFAQGCLQDVHWSMGAFGYFPSYTLGNIYSAQMFDTFTQAYPDWTKDIEGGNFTPLLQWLRSNIHLHGRRYTGPELIQTVTKQPLSTAPYLSYLTKKYSAIYNEERKPHVEPLR